MEECPHFTGEMRYNCNIILTRLGTNSNCQDNKNCPFKQNKLFKECLLDVYNYKMSKRDINKRIEETFSKIQELQKLVKKKLKIIK